jgi:dihydroorotate dehydrogenase electron transfer subunit
LPIYRKYTRDAVRVAANKPVAPDHYAMTLLDAEMAEGTSPGQFFQVRLKGPGAPYLPRPFSIYDWHLDENGRKAGITILYKVVGTGTAALSRLDAGDEVALTGPLGNAFGDPEGADSILILAGGIGIAPFLTLVRSLLEKGVPKDSVSLLYGARTASLIIEEERFRDLGIGVEIATDDGTAGARGTVMELLGRHCSIVPPKRMFVYASGPMPMLNVVSLFCAGRGIRGEVTLEARMICGVGVCNSCAVAVKSPKAPDGWEYKLVCRDGPVFSASSLYLK